MTEDQQKKLMTRLKDEATTGGLIVRFEKHGVLVICLPIHGYTAQEQNHLTLPGEIPEQSTLP
jgi:hypothetical protein